MTISEDRFDLLRNFFRYLVPSIIALLSVSTAAVVDGLLVAHYLGPEAVSAVNLLIPPMTLMFGLSLMFAIGGVVQCTYYRAENNQASADTIFTNTLLVVLAIALLLEASAFVLRYKLFAILGATPDVITFLNDYFCVLLVGVPLQLIAVVLYYFVRGFGYPRAATTALLCGACINVVLDFYFLGVLRLGIASAAAATVAAQITQFLILGIIIYRRQLLRWRPSWLRLKETFHSSANGISEFVNEISVGLVIGVMQWILIRQDGVNAVAGFALVNYGLFINAMVCCAVAEVVYTLASQNIGSGQIHTARAYRRLAIVCVLGFTSTFAVVFGMWGPNWFLFLVPVHAADYAVQYLGWLWPVFILCGINMIISAWFTGCRRVMESTSIAILRSLILPLVFVCFIVIFQLDLPAVAVLPAAEICTLIVAFWLFARFGSVTLSDSGYRELPPVQQ